MMELDYIHMKNFRQYKDVKIEFARSPESNLTVIQGANGAGKTNIMNAITWCLFGKEYHMDSKYAGLPRVNAASLDEKGKNMVEMSVEIQFIDENDKKILITRSQGYRERDGKLIELPGAHAPPRIIMQGERDWGYPQYGEDAEMRIDSLIPKDVEEYFFFDGERMDAYFKEKSGNEIRRAVFQISQLGLFETLIEHLTKRKNEFVKQTKGLSSEAQKIREELEIHQNSLRDDREQLESITKKRDEAANLENELNQSLQSSSSENVKRLQEQRQELEEAIERLQTDIKDLEDTRIEKLHKVMPILFVYDPLLKTKTLIEQRKEAGQIPPMYKAIFIKNLLNKGRCICRSDISNKDEYSTARRKNVEAYLQEAELSELSTELIESNVRIQEMLESIKDFPDEIRNLEKKLNSLLEDKSKTNDKLNRISQEIKQTDIEEIKKLEMQRQEAAKKREDLNIQIGRENQIILMREGRIRYCEVKLKQELKKESKNDNLRNLLAFCEDSLQCARETKDSIMKDVRAQVEKKASDQFLALIWKKDTYKGVVIDDNYNISVPYIDGREALGTLSAGERQVCALSFMAALNSVSGFKVPIIIDTPLARISREPRRNIAENLPNYLAGTQVTLLVTEEEYTKEVREALSKKVGKTYVINFHDESRGKTAEVELVD
jgi:DNA sulfur modification protein DndD